MCQQLGRWREVCCINLAQPNPIHTTLFCIHRVILRRPSSPHLLVRWLCHHWQNAVVVWSVGMTPQCGSDHIDICPTMHFITCVQISSVIDLCPDWNQFSIDQMFEQVLDHNINADSRKRFCTDSNEAHRDLCCLSGK